MLVIGAGNIGRAVGARPASQGHTVAYWDVHPAVRDQLSETGAVVLAPSAVHGSFDLVYVCVPTPTLNGRFSSAQVEGALTTAASLVSARGFTTIVVRSTLLPGMTDTVVRPLLARLAPAGQWGLAYRPSFARERAALADECEPRVAVVACDEDPRTRAHVELDVAGLTCPIRRVSFVEAELIKYGANLFDTVKISFFNALGSWATALAASGQAVADVVAEAAEANWDPAYGMRTVGQPFGGACLPKDLDAFIAYMKESGLPNTALLEATRAVNEALGGPSSAVSTHGA